MGFTSTFGGSALDRYVFDFEAVADPSAGDAGGDPAAGEPAGDGGAADPAGEPSWAPSREEWEQTQQALQQLAQQVTPPYQQQQYQQPEPTAIDPLDDNFQQQLDQYLEARFAPYSEYVQAQQMREGEARAQDILSDIRSRDGDFVFDGSTEKARTLANTYIAQTNQQHPNDPAKAAEAALELAAKDVREWETAVGKAYHEQQLNQLGNLGGARPQQPVGTEGASQFTIPPGGSLMDVLHRHVGTG